MDCERLREDRLDVLYGEASEEARRRVEEHQAHCDACRSEMASFAQLRKTLSAWKLPERARPRVERTRRLPALAAAAGLLLALGGAFGLSGSELRFDNGHFAFRLGRGPSGGDADLRQLLSEQEARHRRDIETLRASLASATHPDQDQILARVEDMIEASEARQAVLVNSSLRDFAARTETQRRYDLARVSASLSYLDVKSGQQLARTSELMGYMLQASEKR